MNTNKQHIYGPVKRSRLDLMGIRFMTDPDPAGAGGDDAAAQAAAAAAAAASGDNAPWTKENFDPDRAWRRIEKMNADREADRVKHEAALAAATDKASKDALAQFAKLLSGAEEPETDPVKLAAKVTDLSTQIAAKDTDLTAAQAAVKAGQLSTNVAILAPSLGANAKLLLANEEFKTSIASVEPTDEAAITAAITKALQANAALKQPPARTGDASHTGPTVQTLQQQLAVAEKANDRSTVISLKRRIAAAKANNN